jgi:ABC-type multidrug transport system ATPase subunit
MARVADIRSQIVQARNRGAAVLLISEDLDEILELSDRILVMSDGKIVCKTAAEGADPHLRGSHKAATTKPRDCRRVRDDPGQGYGPKRSYPPAAARKRDRHRA